MSKIVFLLQSHKDPDHLQRLIRTLRAGCPNSFVLVSHDVTATPLDATRFPDDETLSIIIGQGGRGDFRILDGYLAALHWLRQKSIDYDWVINLSGSDYPVSSLRGLAAELEATDSDGFLHHFDVLEEDQAATAPMYWPKGHGEDRYFYQYRLLRPVLGPWERKAMALPRIAAAKLTKTYRINTAFGLMLGRRSNSTPFSRNFRCYAGSYWHIIRRRCAEYLLDFNYREAATVSYFRHVLIPDESFIQTVLVNNPGFRFVSDNRRYYDMSNSRHGHPRKLSLSDLPTICANGYFFARKLEPSAGGALFDQLDAIALA